MRVLAIRVTSMKGWLNWSSLLLMALTCSGCLLSTTPLFPRNDHGPARTPIRPGFYFAEPSNQGVFAGLADQLGYGVLVELEGTTYRISTTEVDRFRLSAMTGSGMESTKFELFSWREDGFYGYVAQTQVGRDLWGYRRVRVADGGEFFSVTQQHCDHIGGTADLELFEVVEETVAFKQEQNYCLFEDPWELVTFVLIYFELWEQTDTTKYRMVEDRDFIELSRGIKPLTLNQCFAINSVQSLDQLLFKSEQDFPSTRRHIIAASKSHALAIEASGNQFGDWAYILQRTGAGFDTLCKPVVAISLRGIFPQKSVLDLSDMDSSDFELIAELCEEYEDSTCGTLEHMVRSIGGDILVQGDMLTEFPGNKYALTDFITVLGVRGEGSITVFATDLYSGFTRVALRLN